VDKDNEFAVGRKSKWDDNDESVEGAEVAAAVAGVGFCSTGVSAFFFPALGDVTDQREDKETDEEEDEDEDEEGNDASLWVFFLFATTEDEDEDEDEEEADDEAGPKNRSMPLPSGMVSWRCFSTTRCVSRSPTYSLDYLIN
jgi:hypothetical protein